MIRDGIRLGTNKRFSSLEVLEKIKEGFHSERKREVLGTETYTVVLILMISKDSR